MQNIVDWLKNHKLTVFLLLVIVFLLFKNNPDRVFPMTGQGLTSYDAGVSGGGISGKISTLIMPSSPESAPRADVKDRLVQEESNISLLVDDVRRRSEEILDYVSQKGGYMVSSSFSQPQEAPFAHLVVRLPQKELRPGLDYLRRSAIKVTSENLLGTDVTDQYLDLQARLTTLNSTKNKFEEILNQAATVDEILRVQQELINLQAQIDSVKGQQQYLEKTAENAKLIIYLSTDEWSLPYTPEEPSFRPQVVFKQAVRSLVSTIRTLAKAFIWLAVYSVLLVPFLLAWFVWKRLKRNN